MRIGQIVLSTMFILGMPTIGSAITFTVPISITGDYVQGTTVPFQIDLGQQVESVYDVRFHCRGIVTAGIDFEGQPFSDNFWARLVMGPNSQLWAATAKAGAATWPAPESFEGDWAFSDLVGPPHWDFLNDGHAEGRVSLNVWYWIPESPPQALPTGHIDEAWITFQATPVPEPVTMSLLFLGLLPFGRRGTR